MEKFAVLIPYSICLITLICSVLVAVRNFSINSSWHWAKAWRLIYFSGVNCCLTYPSFLLLGDVPFFAELHDRIFWSMVGPAIVSVSLYWLLNFRLPYLRFDTKSDEALFDFSGSFGLTLGTRVITSKPRIFECETGARSFRFSIFLTDISVVRFFALVYPERIPPDACLDCSQPILFEGRKTDLLGEIVDRAWEEHNSRVGRMTDDREAQADELEAMSQTMAAIAEKQYGWKLEAPHVRLLSARAVEPAEETNRPHQVSIV